VHVAHEPLALGLEALEDAALEREAVVAPLALGDDARAEEERRARLDVVGDELQLAKPAERAPRGLVVGRAALLVGAAEALDLLAQAADVAAQAVDERVEQRIEVAFRAALRGAERDDRLFAPGRSSPVDGGQSRCSLRATGLVPR
jgi:hypothetical protein